MDPFSFFPFNRALKPEYSLAQAIQKRSRGTKPKVAAVPFPARTPGGGLGDRPLGCPQLIRNELRQYRLQTPVSSPDPKM